jgi:flagellar hook protein FlgE
MSINGLMRTSVSGMEAQSNRLGAVAGNIANASTVGYKAADAEFSSLLLVAPSTTYVSGGVQTTMRNGISRQGVLESSGSKFDLAISGTGFMLVTDPSGNVALTRAGAFVPDGDGNLVNSAGYTLLGFPAANGDGRAIAVNGTAGLEPVNVNTNRLEATPTTVGTLSVNLPALATEVAVTDLPSTNLPTAISSARSSVVVYGNLGEEIVLDVHYARTTLPGEWEVTVYNAAERSAAGGVPYAGAALAEATLRFDSAGQLAPTGTSSLSIPVPGGATMGLSLAGTTQLATGFNVLTINTDGNPPAAAASIEISMDGTIYETYPNGARRAAYRIPLATVISPDNLIQKSGNVFEPSSGSGDLLVGVAGAGGLGSLVSGALESSTVDLASELTEMIEAQRNYTANSRVFQTGAELMEVLVNLKR